MYTHICHNEHTGSQRTTCNGKFSPSMVWLPKIKLRSSACQ